MKRGLLRASALATGLPLALLAGCTVGPDYRAPSVMTGKAPVPPLATQGAAAFEAARPLPARWWHLYDDPRLDALVDKALVHNTDLRVALATLEQTRAQLREIEVQRTPQTGLTVDPSYAKLSGDARGVGQSIPTTAIYDAAASLSYNLDLFGQLRRSVEAGRADVGAAQAALDLARVNVAGQTASAYASVCSAGLQIAVTQRSIAVARHALDVTQRRFDAGIAGANDVVRARTLLRQTEAGLPGLDAARQAALFTLATLTGDTPEAFPAAVATCATPPLVRQPIPVGDGAALLARRPDVRQAERSLAAAVATIGVSTAGLYPSVSLGGSFGTTATALGHVPQSRAFHWSVGPLITWHVPNLSAARAQIAGSNAAARGALARFDGTVLTALRESDTALVRLARQMDNERALGAARDDAATAQRNVERLYAGGVGEFLDTLDAERTLIQSENSLAQATAQVSQDQVSLFMALGGGWEEAPAVENTALDGVEQGK